jgi:hypothetical protein
VTLPASPLAATEQAIAEAFKRMAPDDYKPMPDRPVPMESPLKDEQPRRAASQSPGTYTHTPGA